MPSLEFETGRARRIDAGLLILGAMTGGALWFGWSGCILMGVLAAREWPPRRLRVHWGDARVGLLLLTQRRVSFRRGLGMQTVYRDELPIAEFARLRRELKRLVVQ